MIPGNLTTTAIITNGLYGGSACKGLITTRFSLYCELQVITPPTGGGGGGYPGRVWDRYEPNDDVCPPPVIPGEEPVRKNLTVTLKISIGNIKVDQTYTVAEKRCDSVVKVFNLLDVTQSRIQATITKLKRIATRAKVFITNLKLK